MEKLRDRVTPALFYDLFLYFRNSPVIESTVGGRIRAYRRFHSRCQLIYCIAHRPTEIVQFPSAHSPVERSTDIGAE